MSGLAQVLWVPGPLPSLNELLAGRAGGAGNSYARTKKKWTNDIALLAKAARLRPMTSARIRFVWHEKHRRRNPDNFSSGGRKLVLDALVMAGVLANDGWDEVAGFIDQWMVSSNAGVMVILEPCMVANRAVGGWSSGLVQGGSVVTRGDPGRKEVHPAKQGAPGSDEVSGPIHGGRGGQEGDGLD